jgi:hypothetical protein
MCAGRDHKLQIRAIGIRQLAVYFIVPRPLPLKGEKLRMSAQISLDQAGYKQTCVE